MSGGGSTNTLDMLRLSPSRGPVPPMDWIGRANAGSGLDLRPTGPRKLTRAPPVARERFALLSVSHERPVTDFLAPKNTRARVYGVGPEVAGSGCPAVRRRIES